MSVTATCGACGRTFVAPAAFVGKRVRCKGCGEIFTVPRSTAGADTSSNSDLETDPLAQLAAVATSDSSSVFDANNPFNHPDEEDPSAATPKGWPYVKPGYTPNILTFNYPGASDVDRWLPICLIVAGFLLVLANANGPDAKGITWIPIVRFVTPALLYLACTFPITMAMIQKAAREQRFMLPPNAKLRCFASYMPAFFLMALMQLQGDVFSVAQFFAAALGLVLSSGMVWLLFRLREDQVGSTVMHGAGGFAIGAVISVALTLGLNKAAASIVASQHEQASVPVSPFGQGLSWLPAPPAPAVAPPHVESASSLPGPIVVAPMPQSSPQVATAIGDLQPGNIEGPIDDVISPMGNSSFIAVVRGKQSAVSVESWNTEQWTRAPGTLQLPGLPAGNMLISPDGEHFAWIAQFPRLSIQIWSFSTASVVYTIDLDRSAGPAQLFAFAGTDQLLIDHMVPKSPVDSVASRPAPMPKPAPVVKPAEPRRPNIFDDMNPPPQPAPAADSSDTGSPAKNTATDAGELVHELDLLDITSGMTMRRIQLPPLTPESKSSLASVTPDTLRYGQNIAIAPAVSRLAVAGWIGGTPALAQFDLATGKSLTSVKIVEIDPDQSRSPSGLAYSDDGQNLAALFENGGSAILLAYDAVTGRRSSDFVYPAGPLEGAQHAPFHGSSICWLDPSPFLLVYGQGIVSTRTGTHIRSADLNLPDVLSQRQLGGDRVLLTTNSSTGKHVFILKLDRSQLETAASSAAN